SLLGSLLLDSEALDNLPYLPVPAFYRESHRVIYRAILTLAEAGVPADLVTLTRHLAAGGELDRVGGPAYLYGLMDGTPISAHANFYAEIVLEAHRKRELINTARIAMQAAYDGKPVDTI